jgi:hypothetical protein
MSFVKLKNKFFVGNYDIISRKYQYGVNTPNGFFGIKYSYIDLSNSDELLQIIPEYYRDRCTISVMDLNHKIPPHTDSGIEAIVNFYIKTNNCKTQFYEFKTSDPKTFKLPTQRDGSIFDEDNLNETGSFISQDGDAYLLDVSQPHAVIPLHDGPVDRKAICLQLLYTTFDEAKQFLKQTNQF